MDTVALGWLAEVACARSMSAAARARGVAVSTVARRLDSLEAELRLRLVDRRSDGLSLTDDGRRILALAEPLLAAADRIGRTAKALRDGGERPAVTVSATEFIVAEVLAPRVAALANGSRPVSVTLRSQGEVVSLAARDADLAVRMARPTGNSLIARKLPAQRLGLFASAKYLGGRDPAAIRLCDERLLGYDDSYGAIPELAWSEREGFADAVSLRTGSCHALMAAALADAGIALLPEAFAIRAGLILVPCADTPPPRVPWLLVHRDLRRVPEISAVHGWIIRCFHELAREAAPAATGKLAD